MLQAQEERDMLSRKCELAEKAASEHAVSPTLPNSTGLRAQPNVSRRGIVSRTTHRSKSRARSKSRSGRAAEELPGGRLAIAGADTGIPRSNAGLRPAIAGAESVRNSSRLAGLQSVTTPGPLRRRIDFSPVGEP